jgi:AAA family ATP:ADP antiporter
VIINQSDLSPFERFVSLFTRIRPGEGRSVGWLLIHAFLLMCAYYLARTSKETFIITEGSAALRSYASGIQAALLIFLLPLYGMLFRLPDKSLLIQRINLILGLSLIPFYLAHHMSIHIGIPLFIWGGIMAVMVTSQFWAFATDLFNVKTGQRLFAVIGIGISLGSLCGAMLAKMLIQYIGADGLMIASSAFFLATLPLSRLSSDSVPEPDRPVAIERKADAAQKVLGGLALVLKDRYLLLIACLVVLLNWSGATGEFILNDYIKAASMAMPESAREGWVGAFQADIMFWVTLLSALFQLLIVSRLILRLGVHKAVIIAPAVFVIGYLAMAAIPLLFIVRGAVIAIKSLDYSLLNTCRNALLLPADRSTKYEGKTAIDTLFFRFGDLLSALTVLVGVEILGLTHLGFISVNICLSGLMLLAAFFIGREYAKKAALPAFNSAPYLGRKIPDARIKAGVKTHHPIPHDAFLDSDAGDVITLRAQQECGKELPQWLSLNTHQHTIVAHPPAGHCETLIVRIVATDYDGLSASQTFQMIVIDE